MERNAFIYPINHIRKMTVEQQHRYLYLLIEGERLRQQDGGLQNYKPKWWPNNIKYRHPIRRDTNVMLDEWKRSLFELFQNYFQVNTDYLYYSALAKCVIKNDGRNFGSQVVKKKKSEEKVNDAVVSPVPKDDSRICIKEKTIKLIINEPKIVLYDVVKYGVIDTVKRERSEQEYFLLNLELIKTGETPRSNRNERSFRYSKAKANVRIQTKNTKFDYFPNSVADSKSIETDNESRKPTKLHKELRDLLKTLTKKNSQFDCFRNLKSIANKSNLIKNRFSTELRKLSKTTSNNNCKINDFISDCETEKPPKKNLKVHMKESKRISKNHSNQSLQNNKNTSNHQCTPCFVRLDLIPIEEMATHKSLTRNGLTTMFNLDSFHKHKLPIGNQYLLENKPEIEPQRKKNSGN